MATKVSGLTQLLKVETPDDTFYFHKGWVSVKFYGPYVIIGTENLKQAVEIRLDSFQDGAGTPISDEASIVTYIGGLLEPIATGTPGDSVITQQVASYSNLVAGTVTGQLAYVESAQGTTWLPGGLGGSYYPAGLYLWTGASWVSDRNAIATALQDTTTDLVPYTGATQDVDLGVNGLIAQSVQVSGGIGAEGTLTWNAQEATMDLQSGGVTYQIGQEIAPLVRNSTGVTITNGTPVRFSGTLGNSGRILIAPAIADGTIPSSYILGVATEDIINGADGHITWFGKVRGIDTSGTPYGQVWADGDIIYVSATTAGWLTNVKPQAPSLQIFIGAVVNAHSSNGTLFTRPSWRSSLEDLDDVNGTPATVSGQILVWDNDLKVFDFTDNINEYAKLTNQIIVTQANVATTLGGTIDSTKEYFIDGVIFMGTTQITVPPGGIELKGYSFNGSGLYATADNYTMFVSESIAIGSGDILGVDFYIAVVGTNSKVYEVYDANGFHAIEMNRVNYNDCTSLGDIYDYRQGLELGTGRFGGSPSLTLHGLWRGGFRISTSITRSMSDTTTAPLFCSGALFQMNSRFLTDMNVDLGTLQPFTDFSPADFPNPSSLEFVDVLLTRDGVINAEDSNITPNVSEADICSAWSGNHGIHNTFVGGASDVTVEVATVITTINVATPILGTFVASDLQHFDAPANGQLRFLGTNPIEYSISWDFILDGTQNAEYRIELVRERSGTPTVIYGQTRVINNLQGGRDVAYFTGSHHESILQNDITYWQVKNLTGTGNCTLEFDSDWTVDHR